MQRRFRNFEVIRQIRRIIQPIIRRIKNTLSQRSVDTHTHTVYRVKRPRGTIAALLLSHETEVISRTTTGKLAIAY